MRTLLRALLRDEQGASLVEYAVIVALIAVVSIVVLATLGNNASSVLAPAATSI
ncbi:MAG: Flp family type IVb pilin [Candidatus Eremiobacteraeota bacterium]|nr:Flp family type IVb pilin [Candidatus Eremiobacteraeota bacterium]MBV8722606.1 Flp family type IVb pilin [Candidatus Eremiobacteraeota bacterium]